MKKLSIILFQLVTIFLFVSIINASDNVIDSLIQKPVSKLDFSMYRIEMHLNDYFKKIKPTSFEFWPSAIIVFYSQEKSKIITCARFFTKQRSRGIHQYERHYYVAGKAFGGRQKNFRERYYCRQRKEVLSLGTGIP